VHVLSWVGFAAGIGLVLQTGSSVFKYLMVPRSTRSVLTNIVAWSVLAGYRVAGDRIPDLTRKERVMAFGAPTFLVSMLVTWLVGMFAGFTLILLPFCHDSLGLALRVSGSSMFTLGIAVPPGHAPDAIVFVAAASGLGTVALLIAYLPVMYAAFNRRETLVTMLEALGGSPPWGPELLARQALIDNIKYLPRLYERWTEWAADIMESHTAYRNLVYFRSPDPTSSWLISLLAVLDAAALHLALAPGSAPPEARVLLRVGYTCTHKLAAQFGLPVSEDPDPDGPLELTRADFDEAVRWLQQADWIIERDPDDAWPHFRGWRVNYEAPVYALALFLDLPPALWSGRRRDPRRQAQPPRRPPHRVPAADGGPAKPGQDARPGAGEDARPGTGKDARPGTGEGVRPAGDARAGAGE
jgi:hypothetical protein